MTHRSTPRSTPATSTGSPSTRKTSAARVAPDAPPAPAAPADPASPAARLDRTLAAAAADGRAALTTYLPVGYPTMADSVDTLRQLGQSADILELGVPHTDPALDGPVIRDATAQALASGFRMPDLFAATRELSTSAASALLVMSYWAPIEHYGADRFAHELADAGGSAVLLPDLAVEDAGPWLSIARSAGLHTVNLIPADASAERLADVCAASGGMVYAPATPGVTGAQGPLSPELPDLVDHLRTVTALPIGVGIGVSTAEQAARVATFADAVVVGSALIRSMRATPDSTTAASDLAREFADAMHRPTDRPGKGGTAARSRSARIGSAVRGFASDVRGRRPGR